MRTQKGFSLLSVLIASVIGALGIVLIMRMISIANTTASRSQAKNTLDNTLATAASHLIRVGRTAKSCTKTASSPDTLTCSIDEGHPPTGTLKNVRFVVTANGLEFQTQVSGSYQKSIAYAGITSFTLCDDTLMAAGTCPLEPLVMSTLHQTYVSTSTNRFYRFLLSAPSTNSNGITSSKTAQGAFFVRPALPTGAVYEW